MDDQSLLAMRDARMSVASIAQTMGWGLERTQRRLDFLTREPSERPAEPEAAPACAPAPEREMEAAIGEGEGLVLRVFAVHPDGNGADCRVADGRNVFTLTGERRLEPGQRVAVVQAGDVWRLAEGRSDA
ncbi:hypothetical protein [Phenylobacterium sp.]|uniref:hypothetical protein n=1 Tax=Phenylobacterium sp. TaxID=1871053 RepID=UPI0019CBD2F9|nr:hypothetical protein [Phenylobacterium sp.]MBC7169065.1 hypothetical protein [Phenylobacterium sp.]